MMSPRGWVNGLKSATHPEMFKNTEKMAHFEWAGLKWVFLYNSI